jgi:hypothetical protein
LRFLVVDPPRLADDLNDDRTVRNLAHYAAVVESVAARIVPLLGPEERAFWSSALGDDRTLTADPEPGGSGNLVDTYEGTRDESPRVDRARSRSAAR